MLVPSRDQTGSRSQAGPLVSPCPGATTGGLDVEIAIDGHGEPSIGRERGVANTTKARIGGGLLQGDEQEREVHLGRRG